jgi:hypothetical protein
MHALEHGNWHVATTVRRFDQDLAEFIRERGELRGPIDFAKLRPYDEERIEGNLLVTVGIQLLEDLLIGAGGTVYSNANARIGVGDSATAAAIGQIDLQAATNKIRVVMDATFPSRAGTTLSWKSSFTGAVANWAWQEWGIFNGNTANVGMLNRKVESLGTKASGTWTLQTDVTIT